MREFPRVNEIPFTSETKRMTTLHTTPDGVVAYAKGAPEIILDSCTWQLTEAARCRLDSDGQSNAFSAPRNKWPARRCACWPWPPSPTRRWRMPNAR